MTAARWGFFLAWAVAGAGTVLSVVAVLSIGPLVLVATAAWIGLLVMQRGARGPAALGAIAGPAAVAFWLAWNNRDGPGDVCTSTARETSCEEQWNPWPFAAVGVVLLVAAVGLFVVVSRRSSAPAGRI